MSPDGPSGLFFVSAALSRDQLEALRRAFEPEAVLAALDEALETVGGAGGEVVEQ